MEKRQKNYCEPVLKSESYCEYWRNRSEWIDIMAGVRQGSLLSPVCSPYYGQKVMDDLKGMGGVWTREVYVNNIKYANSTMIRQ